MSLGSREILQYFPHNYSYCMVELYRSYAKNPPTMIAEEEKRRRMTTR
jgi:hypothetical protein